MWPYTDSENDWLEARKADIAADRPVYADSELVAHYIREGERMRAEATLKMFCTVGRAIGRGVRRLGASLRPRRVDRHRGGRAQPTA